MRKAILLVVLAVAIITSLTYWLIVPGVSLSTQEFVMILILILVVGFGLFQAFRRLRDAKQNLPTEDEMSKKILRRGAATSYYVSLYLWLALMGFEERIDLERSTLIGAGIAGMAVIYVLAWIFHRYIRRSHD